MTTDLDEAPSKNLRSPFTAPDYAIEQRRLALNDAITQTRRAASAALAAAAGELDPRRAGILRDANRRLLATLRELEALT
jgi:hypothetical protein